MKDERSGNQSDQRKVSVQEKDTIWKRRWVLFFVLFSRFCLFFKLWESLLKRFKRGEEERKEEPVETRRHPRYWPPPNWSWSESESDPFWVLEIRQSLWGGSVHIGGHRYRSILCASKLLWLSSDLKIPRPGVTYCTARRYGVAKTTNLGKITNA